MQMLRITSCSNSSYWYAGKIGSVVQYLGLDRDEYITREPSGYVNIIKFADAEVVDVLPASPSSPSIEPEAPAEKRFDMMRVELSFPDGAPASLVDDLRRYMLSQAAIWVIAREHRCTFAG
jgi:hypothetical protein